MTPLMWAERRNGHLFVWWRGVPIYKVGPGTRELVLDSFGPAWPLPVAGGPHSPPPSPHPAPVNASTQPSVTSPSHARP